MVVSVPLLWAGAVALTQAVDETLCFEQSLSDVALNGLVLGGARAFRAGLAPEGLHQLVLQFAPEFFFLAIGHWFWRPASPSLLGAFDGCPPDLVVLLEEEGILGFDCLELYRMLFCQGLQGSLVVFELGHPFFGLQTLLIDSLFRGSVPVQ